MDRAFDADYFMHSHCFTLPLMVVVPLAIRLDGPGSGRFWGRSAGFAP